MYNIGHPICLETYMSDLKRFYGKGWSETWKTRKRDKPRAEPWGDIIMFGLMDNYFEYVEHPLYNPDTPPTAARIF